MHSYEPKLTPTQVNLWTDIYSKDDKTRASRFWATMWFDEFETSTGFRGKFKVCKLSRAYLYPKSSYLELSKVAIYVFTHC